MTSCPFLDDLFSWAAGEPQEYQENGYLLVNFLVATNQSTVQGQDENVVTYASGQLTYSPGGFTTLGKLRVYHPPSFSGSGVQYFSNRLWGESGSFTTNPFNPNETDSLDMSILAPPIYSPTATYSVSVSSPWWSTTQTFAAQCQPGGIYGTADGEELFVISLCNKRAALPPPSG